MLKKLFYNSKRYLKKEAPTILTFMGAAGVIGTAIMAAKATPKALDLIEVARDEKGEDLTKIETVVVAAPAYIPSFLIGVSTIACIFGANVLNKRQQAALTSAYMMLNNSYKEYRNKLIELHSKEADEEIRKEILKDKIAAAPQHITPANGLQDICDNQDKVLFYDSVSNRYFESTYLDVQAAEYYLSRTFVLMGYVTPNDFYDFLGIPRVDFGDEIGWSMEEGYTWLDFEHIKSELDDGLTCCIIYPVFSPDAEYDPYI